MVISWLFPIIYSVLNVFGELLKLELDIYMRVFLLEFF